MKRLLMFLCTIMLVFGMLGSASATLYYEAYEGWQYISQNTSDYWFDFDIDLADNGNTNSSLDFTHDATGFEYWNDEQLGSVQITLDLYGFDRREEAFNLDVDIYWSDADFTETVTFNATWRNNNYYYTYDFTQQQIDGWEEGGWGRVTIDAFNIPGGWNFNNFVIAGAALTAESAPVPEPATILLMGAGLLGLVGYNRKRSRKKS